MELLAYGCAVLIGLIMGLIGGGGSVLSVPIFAYLLGMDMVFATAYSLFVVGVTSAVGAARNISQGTVDFRTGVIFAIPALVTVYLTRRFVVPMIPDPVIDYSSITLSKDAFLMFLFAIIMLASAISMIIRKTPEIKGEAKKQFPVGFILAEGVVVGVLTGLVGAGGGFLIVPALVMVSKLPMKTAIGTSLLIISIKSLIGFVGDVQNLAIDWKFLLAFSSLSIAGIIIGVRLTKVISANRLKVGFGYFVLIMSLAVICVEIFNKS